MTTRRHELEAKAKAHLPTTRLDKCPECKTAWPCKTWKATEDTLATLPILASVLK